MLAPAGPISCVPLPKQQQHTQQPYPGNYRVLHKPAYRECVMLRAARREPINAIKLQFVKCFLHAYTSENGSKARTKQHASSTRAAVSNSTFHHVPLFLVEQSPYSCRGRGTGLVCVVMPLGCVAESTETRVNPVLHRTDTIEYCETWRAGRSHPLAYRPTPNAWHLLMNLQLYRPFVY